MSDIVKTYVIGLLATIIVALGGYSYLLKTQVSNRDKDIASLESTMEKKNETIALQKQSLEFSNGVIAQFKGVLDSLKSETLKKQEEILAALEATRKITDKYESSAARLLATTPKSSNICVEADDLINSYLKDQRASK